MLLLHRIALPSINAIFITLGLIYAMFLLVNIVEPEISSKPPALNLGFVHVPEESELITKIIKPEPPKEIEITPPVIMTDPIVDKDINGDTDWGVKYSGPERITTLSAINDSQLVLALGFPPEYPRSALPRGLEGYVVVGFSVDSAGSVYDAYIIESEPQKVFDRSALKAIMKFKYKARMVNGKPMSTEGQRYMFSYKMDS